MGPHSPAHSNSALTFFLRSRFCSPGSSGRDVVVCENPSAAFADTLPGTPNDRMWP